jgi:hypothetical protein
MNKSSAFLLLMMVHEMAFAADSMETYLRRYQIDNCYQVNVDVPKFSIRKGDVLKVNEARLGVFDISEPLKNTSELKRFCRNDEPKKTIGTLEGVNFKKWPNIVLNQKNNDIIEKCFVIDGPANIRKKPKSEIVNSIDDFAVAKVLDVDGDWFLISEPIKPLGSESFFFPLRCLTSSRLIPLGWTHRNNLKAFPHPLIQRLGNGIKILNIEETIVNSLSKHQMGMGELSINFFVNSKVKSKYWGGILIYRGYMEGSDAYFFSDSDIKKVNCNSEFIRVTNNGFEISDRQNYSEDGTCEVVTKLIHPDGNIETIGRNRHGIEVCGAG